MGQPMGAGAVPMGRGSFGGGQYAAQPAAADPGMGDTTQDAVLNCIKAGMDETGVSVSDIETQMRGRFNQQQIR